ncbi:YCF48-related protein [Neptuniibacter sp. 1_MG-2023]|uniref:WD40/YVTN/BNR-like repeat-containing protein n=1 Tax=Neptuniibacter sp. 1_MG-2023 TaxID=3062662 RepID=UPI0026E189FF|nr:YCF48-related protein [Neptuniibacter sp. 1_MG-2023]MDO6594775.1 YCF48-related protein [Neptuniibacter sp. 1_MG-2023]
MSKITFSYSVVFGCFLALSQCVLADRLVQSAIQQAAPEKSLLLTISRAGKRLVAGGEQGVIIYSGDRALTWKQAEVPTSTLITSLNFFDKQTGWAVGHDGVILGTKDGGLSWQKRLDGAVINQLRVDALETEFNYQNSLGAVDADLLENLGYQLDDAKIAVEEGPSSPLLDIIFLDSLTGYAVGAYGLFLKTNDGGLSWVYEGYKLPNPDSLHLNRVIQTQAGHLLILGEAGLLIESLDNGGSWHKVELPYQGSLFSAVEADSLYLMGLRGTVLKRTRDELGSTVWNKIDIGSTATINDAIVVDDIAYLVGQGGALLQKQGEAFVPFQKRGLRSYSAVESVGQYLIVVGEGGVSRIDLNGGTD